MAERLSELAFLSLCRLYLYSAQLFPPLMTAASLLGLSEAASVVIFLILIFHGLTEDFQKQKPSGSKMHKLSGLQGVAEKLK